MKIGDLKKKLLISLITLLGISGVFATCDYYIDSCQDLNVSDSVYCLNTSISYSVTHGTCFNIVNVNNVTLDCHGYSVSTSVGDKGVYTWGSRDTIKNCNFTGFWWAVQLGSHGGSNNITDSYFVGNHYAIDIEDTNYNRISNVTVDCGGLSGTQGVSISGTNYLYNSKIRNCGTGVRKSGNTERIINNTIENCSDGIWIYQGGYAYIYNNLLNNTNNVKCTNPNGNHWNVTKQKGYRIYGNSSYIGGNYYTNLTGNGYSDTCVDINTDGLCDNQLDLCYMETDYLPLSDEWDSYWVISSNVTSCYNSTSLMNNVTYHDENEINPDYSVLTYTTCNEHYTCTNGICVYTGYCGDGNCQILEGENQDNCCTDCGCPFYHRCTDNVCVETAGDVGGGLGEEVGDGLLQMAIPLGGLALFGGIIIILIASVICGVKDGRGR